MCDHKAAKCVESTGGIDSGAFQEYYTCPCGAEGWIEGQANEPAHTWDKYGEVFL